MIGRKNLSSLLVELERQTQNGRNKNSRQQARIDELRNLAANNPQQLNRSELEFLQSVDAMELNEALQRQALAEEAELTRYKTEIARGQKPSDQKRFDKLIGAETERRNQEQRKKMGRNIAIGAGVAGTGAIAAALATQNAAATGGMPFSTSLSGGDGSTLAAQQYLIAKELEAREFQDGLAQRTAIAQTNLANDLMARQQKAMFDANLANSIQRQQAGALNSQGGGVDVISKINSLAAQYMEQGIEPPKAFDLAQNALRMDGSANNYL